MRFQRLHIPAFGPFTNLELKFPVKGHDLHVIYGENEAGKSTLLRAMRDLLFGIHGQSADNFLHDYKKLRLVGEIVNRAGDQLVFQRRKGNKNTLLDQQDNALPDSALLPFMGSVDQAYFSTMFGLGGRELRDGAEQLLRGEGEIGNALFSASLGGTPIQRVLDSLVEESERLFKGKATSNVSIRPAVKRYKELLKQSRDAMVHPETWNNLEKELAEQEAMRKRLADEIADLDGQLNWLARCEDALPSVGRLSEETELLNELPELPDLASDFVERARTARNAANKTSETVQTLVGHLARLEVELADIQTSPEILGEAEALDSLRRNLGAYGTRKESLANLRSKLAGVEPGLRSGMKSLGIDGEFESLKTLQLSSAVRLGCEEAAGALREAIDRRNEAAGKTNELKRDIESFESNLKSMPETDLTSLREALAIAAEATDANKTLAASAAEVGNLTRKVVSEHALVIGAPEDLDAAANLAVPTTSTIRRFREQFDRIDRGINAEEATILGEGKRVKAIQAELNRMERRGELPTEGALHEARIHRDHGWELVLAEWKGDGAKEELVPGSPLEEAYPETIVKADEIADQLRQQAEAVAQAEEKRFQITRSEKLIADAQEKLAVLRNERAECETAWEAAWEASKVKGRSPEEMEEWRDAWIELRETLSRLRAAEATVKAKTQTLLEARKALASALGDSQEKDFAVLFEAARQRVQEGEELTGSRREIKAQLQTRGNLLESVEQKSAGLVKAVETSTANWNAQCQTAGLPTDTSPDTGLRLLQERKELLAKFDAWTEYSGEASNTTQAVEKFEQAVESKAAAHNVNGDTVEAQEAGLWNALSQARKAQAESDQFAAQIKKSKTDLADARQEEARAIKTLEKLMHLAKLNAVEELEPLLANLEQQHRVQSRIDDFRKTLSGLARGQALDEFVARVQAENAEELPQRRTRIDSDRAEKTAELQTIRDMLTALNSQKRDLERAGDAAADYRQQAESVASAIGQDASRFVRLRLAVHCLRTQIERFREENQGPLLEKSGQIFKHITRGAFESLGAEFNDQDVPVMVGRRADGSNVTVDGMSDGSRDQLYLALRLAALDRYLEEHEPMPLILDDLLITFDDERAKAILPQLADLATRTQIYLFTHHEHLVELCRQTLGEDQFHFHKLSGISADAAD
jgi:uncharacterized protein YhaN